jgi:hypothetical protein
MVGINKKTRVIRADTRFSVQCALRGKPGFLRAHPFLFFIFYAICIKTQKSCSAGSAELTHQTSTINHIKNRSPKSKTVTTPPLNFKPPLLNHSSTKSNKKNTESHCFPSSSALPSLIFDKISQKGFFLLTPQTPNSVSHTTFHPSSIKTSSFFFSSSSLRNYGLRFSSTLSAFSTQNSSKTSKKSKFQFFSIQLNPNSII